MLESLPPFCHFSNKQHHVEIFMRASTGELFYFMTVFGCFHHCMPRPTDGSRSMREARSGVSRIAILVPSQPIDQTRSPYKPTI